MAQESTLVVHAVYITSDAAFALTPGALCREYMSSSPWVTPSTRIVLEGSTGKQTRAVTSLPALWPQPSVYTRLTRNEQLELAKRLERVVMAKMAEATQAGHPEATVWVAAHAAAILDDKSDLHPLRYGAAVAFDDGCVVSATQKKALEYSCTLDPVCQLAQAIYDRAPRFHDTQEQVQLGQARLRRARPVLLCMADQYGVCHAPFAPARAFLAEHGCGDCRVLTHDATGVLHILTAEELMPSLPDFAEHLS